MINFVQNSESTHAPEVQASMGTLLVLLRKRYLPKLQSISDVSQDLTGNITATRIVTDYLTTSLTSSSEYIQLLSFINGDYSKHDALIIEEKIQEILLQNPAIPNSLWTGHDEHWAINRVYDATSNTTKEISASPAETLLLTLLAIFDEARLPEENRNHVLKNLANNLLRIAEEEHTSGYLKCSGGRQHDLLFVLNQAWKNDADELIIIVQDISAFIANSVITFRSNWIGKLSENQEFALLMDILKSQQNETHQSTSTTIYNEEFQESCREFLKQRFDSVGLRFQDHLEQCNGYIDYIDDMPNDDALPNSGRLPTTVIKTLFLGSEDCAFFLEEHHNISVSYSQSLARLKNMLANASEWTSELHEIVTNFYTARHYLLQLQQDEYILCFDHAPEDSDSESAAVDTATLSTTIFHSAWKTLYWVLSNHFNSISTAIIHQWSIATYNAYQNNIAMIFGFDFVSSFFTQELEQDHDIEFLYHIILQRQPYIQLSNETLRLWMKDSERLGEFAVYPGLSPYQINRILLHGWSVDFRDWSTDYAQTLCRITDWLMNSQEEASKVAQQIYPTDMLRNLNLYAFMGQSSELKKQLQDHIAKDKKYLHRTTLFDDWMSSKSMPAESIALMLHFFIERGALEKIIKNVRELATLFTLTEEQLNAEYRTLILNALQGELPNIINDALILTDFFQLSDSQLNAEHRTLILNALQGELPNIINDALKLTNLLQLSSSQLNAEQRATIWRAIEGGLATIIEDASDLAYLFQLTNEQLSARERTLILDAIEQDLSRIISIDDELFILFKLTDTELNAEHRTLILNALREKLPEIIHDPHYLIALLNLPDVKLNTQQRALIVNTLQETLPNIIQSGYYLAQLLKLSDTQLNAEQRATIWRAIEGEFAGIIKEASDLVDLFQLTNEQLSARERTLILDAIEQDLSKIIRTDHELFILFKLTDTELNAEHRTKIWTAIQDKLPDHVLNVDSLSRLSQLSETQFSPEQRRYLENILAQRSNSHFGADSVFSETSSLGFFGGIERPVQTEENTTNDFAAGRGYAFN